MPYSIKEVQFIKSSTDVKTCPSGNLPEYAFVGRSNVGKSSLINLITGKKKLAKTSSMPGKTQLINHFLVDELWYLVDLPGYGFAKVNKVDREKFLKMIWQYLLKRDTMVCLFLLVDSRHDPLENDLQFIRWLGENNIPFAICFTKTDKITPGRLASTFDRYKKILLKEWEELPPVFFTSTENNQGKDDILDFIFKTNKSLTS